MIDPHAPGAVADTSNRGVRSRNKITERGIVYRALTGISSDAHFAIKTTRSAHIDQNGPRSMIATPLQHRQMEAKRNRCAGEAAPSEPHGHPDMARLKSEPDIKPLGIDAG